MLVPSQCAELGHIHPAHVVMGENGRSVFVWVSPKKPLKLSKEKGHGKKREKSRVNNLFGNGQCLEVLVCQTLSVDHRFNKLFLDSFVFSRYGTSENQVPKCERTYC